MLMKNKIVALLSVLVISSSANAFAYSEGDYHTPTSKEEIDYTDSVELPQLKKERQLQKSAFLENKIKQPLIKYNSTKLKASYSKYDDGLRDVFVADGNSTSIGEAGHQTAGYVFLTNGYLKSSMGNNFDDYNIYGLSAIASTYAHEAGHWYYEDSWTWDNQKDTNEIRKFKEGRADKFALQLIDNVPNFSVGGHLIDIYYSLDSDTSLYPSKQERLSYAYDYIKNASNGRVYFENDKYSNHLLVSDINEEYEFEVYPPRQYRPDLILNEVSKEVKTTLATAESRAFYVSGAISWAIKHGVWNKNSVSFEDAHKYFANLPKNINATVIIARSDNSYKIVDWYLSDEYLTVKQAKELNNYLEMLKASYRQ